MNTLYALLTAIRVVEVAGTCFDVEHLEVVLASLLVKQSNIHISEVFAGAAVDELGGGGLILGKLVLLKRFVLLREVGIHVLKQKVTYYGQVLAYISL